LCCCQLEAEGEFAKMSNPGQVKAKPTSIALGLCGTVGYLLLIVSFGDCIISCMLFTVKI